MRARILPLEVSRLTFEAGEATLIDHIDITLAAGPLTLIIGPNGAGKSLFLRLCHGLLAPSSGQVTWRGRNGADPRTHQSFVFQHPRVLNRTVLENVEYPLKIRGVSFGSRRALAETALKQAGLEQLAARLAPDLSGGELQKLALARAWVSEPEVLFLDEPTSNLDPKSTFDVEELIKVIHGSGAKVIMTSHDLAQMRRLADEVIFMHRGRIFERGNAETLLKNPATAELAAFLRGELLV